MENAANPKRAGAAAVGFNSATAVMPWKTRSSARWRRTFSSVLQFGHGGDAVENLTEASVWEALLELQFGHGGDAVENKIDAYAALVRTYASIRPRR